MKPGAAQFYEMAPSHEEWNALLRDIVPAKAFLTAAWFEHWSRSFLPLNSWCGPLSYLVARGHDGALIGLAPFAMQKKAGIKFTSLGGYYSPFRSIVLADSARHVAAENLAVALSESADCFALRYGPVRADDEDFAALNAALVKRGWRLNAMPAGATVAVDLPTTWDAFERRLGRKLRVSSAYYERKMQREGVVVIREFSGSNKVDWSGVIADLGHVEAQSWLVSETGNLRFLGDRNHRFWLGLLSQSEAGDHVRVWLMYWRGSPVSFCFAMDYGYVRYVLANQYSEAVRNYRTGSILYRYMFRDAIESGTVSTINIGAGDSGYKSRWGANPSFRLKNWLAFPPGVRGRLLDLGLRAWNWLHWNELRKAPT
jgi:Acetyltransferase (GNAT) domain